MAARAYLAVAALFFSFTFLQPALASSTKNDLLEKRALEKQVAAAKTGDTRAQENVCRYYFDLPEADMPQALTYCLALLEHRKHSQRYEALRQVIRIYLEGRGVPKDEAKALSFLQAYQSAFPISGAYQMAQFYEGKQAHAQDLAQAEKLYLFAAEHGHGAAALRLMRLYASDAFGAPNWSQAYFWGFMAQEGRANDKTLHSELAAIADHLTVDEVAAQRLAARAAKPTPFDVAFANMPSGGLARAAAVCVSGYLLLALLWVSLREGGVPVLRRHRNKTVFLFAFLVPLFVIFINASQWVVTNILYTAVLQEWGGDARYFINFSIFLLPGFLSFAFLSWWPHGGRPALMVLLLLPYSAAIFFVGLFFNFILSCEFGRDCM